MVIVTNRHQENIFSYESSPKYSTKSGCHPQCCLNPEARLLHCTLWVCAEGLSEAVASTEPAFEGGLREAHNPLASQSALASSSLAAEIPIG